MHYESASLDVGNSILDIVDFFIFLNADSSCEYLQKGWLFGLIKPIFAHDYFGFQRGL